MFADNGQCVPIKCVTGVPPQECTRLCALRHYIPVCQPPGDFCLCQRLSGGFIELVSPDEILDQPPDQEPSGLNIFAFIVPLDSIFREDRWDVVDIIEPPPRRVSPSEHHKVPEPPIRISSESYENVNSFTSLSLENSWNTHDISEEVIVNVHEGRLYWLFRYVLSGLFLLIVALIMFEVIMCQVNNNEKFSFEDEPQEEEKPIKTKERRTLDIV